ncbi:30008_t:CDS:2, partial [Gigaspora margarita]
KLDSALKMPFVDRSRTNVEADQTFANVFGILLPDNRSSSSKWEYNEWCKVGLLLDKALLTSEVEYVHLSRQVALERAYIVRMVDEVRWCVAAKMLLENSMDPMSESFGGKHEKARIAA